MLCVPDEADGAAGETLVRPMFGMHRMEWSDDDSVEFHLPHGKMIALLRESGFEVEGLIEFRRPGGLGLALHARHARMGPEVAVRGGLEGPQTRVVPFFALPLPLFIGFSL